MLAPSPNVAFSPPAARIDACVVAGEDAPTWLAAAFAVAGTLVAVMSASLWQQAPAAPQATTVIMVPPAVVAEPDPKPPETPMPLPAQIVAPPMPLPPAIPVEPPAPAAPAALAEPQSAAKSSIECFAPLAIAFERGSTRPNPADMKRSLAVLQEALARHGGSAILIEGHADASGSEDLNVLLSYSRAKAVAELLKKDGIPAQQMTIRAAGAGLAHGNADAVAADRKALLRIAGVDDCDHLIEARRP